MVIIMRNIRPRFPGSRVSDGYCPACGKPVDLIIVAGGTSLRINPDPVYIRYCWDGNGNTYVLSDGKYAFGVETAPGDRDALLAYVPHRGVCPNNGRRVRRLK